MREGPRDRQESRAPLGLPPARPRRGLLTDRAPGGPLDDRGGAGVREDGELTRDELAVEGQEPELAVGEDVRASCERDRPLGALLHEEDADSTLGDRHERREDEVDGFLVERGPNSVRMTDEIEELARDVGLGEELLSADPRAPRYVYLDGRLVRAPMGPASLVTTTTGALL